ncbi:MULTISPECIES: DUF669 domain-containing protein [Bacillus cereus group]|uniref:DUF669 domain-containing protein n=1 Tax=Bacillus cereus group TaxID=86661 RepID=UPI0011A64358|nr:DUF669 domain-containing protein [Bacillus thuringiensis]
MFTVDYSQVRNREKVIPGEYEVTVVHYEQTTSQNGNPRILLNYEIRSDVEQPCQGKQIRYDNFVVTENSMWRLHECSEAVGIPDHMHFKSYKEWADTLLHKSLRVTVEEREYKGKKYPQVNEFHPSKVAPTPSRQISDLDVPF